MRKNIAATLLAALVAVGSLIAPSFAVTEIQEPHDNGINQVWCNNTIVAFADRYDDGFPCEATLEEMDAMRVRCHENGYEIDTPDVIKITASSVAFAEEQIRTALKYAPKSIEVTFTRSVPRSEQTAFYDYYANWEEDGHPIDLFIGAMLTFTYNDKTLTVTRDDNTVKFNIDYAEGWLAYVDTQDWIRCFSNEDYSRELASFAKTHLRPIAEAELSEGEKFAAIGRLLQTVTQYDDDIGTYDVLGEEWAASHSIYGAIMNHLTVCDGYAYTVQFAAAYLGLDAFVVTGRNIEAFMGHAWNKVKVDDKWYVMDMASIASTAWWLTPDTFLAGDDIEGGFFQRIEWCNDIYPAPAAHPDRAVLWD